ncbi:MAG TPA: ABC transporter substrate-binding protein [Longimicrobiales bacterium]|nr:ABC transporter substrate-binding protein [Longimicrobiales bacterium]
MNRRDLLIVLLALSSAACVSEPNRIGVWMGPTGANVAKMAESDINFKGGAADRRVEARVVSQRAVVWSELTPDALAMSLDSMAADTTVLAVITRLTDSIAEAATASFERHRIPYLIATPVAADYARTHPNAFMLVPSVEEQAEFLVEQGLREAAPRRIAIMHVREPHADRLTQAITQALQRRGTQPDFITSFSQQADELNLQAKANELISNRPTVLYWIGRSPSLAVLHPILRNALPELRLLSSDLVETFQVYQNPQSVFTGMRFVRYSDPMSADSIMTGLRDKVQMWIGRNELNNEALLAYDAMQLVAKVIDQHGATRAAVANGLRSISHDGLLGTVRFGADQRAQRTMYLAEVRGGVVETVAQSRPLQVTAELPR